jgi:hypothetical protein
MAMQRAARKGKTDFWAYYFQLAEAYLDVRNSRVRHHTY